MGWTKPQKLSGINHQVDVFFSRTTNKTGIKKPSRNHLLGLPVPFISCVYYIHMRVSFQQWGYPQIIDFHGIFHYKPTILGYLHDYGNLHTEKKKKRGQNGKFLQQELEVGNLRFQALKSITVVVVDDLHSRAGKNRLRWVVWSCGRSCGRMASISQLMVNWP